MAKSLKIISDREAIYDTEKYDVILMGVSTHNIFMGNFQGKMIVKYPIIEKVGNRTPYGDLRKLGKRVTINDNVPIISLMYICKYPSRKGEYLDYEALEKCLKTANAEFKGKKVMTTFLGVTKFDGNGDKEKCLKIIEECTPDLDLTVYDYEQVAIRDEMCRIRKELSEIKEKNKDNDEFLKEFENFKIQYRKERFLPIEKYNGNKRKPKEEDEILNF